MNKKDLKLLIDLCSVQSSTTDDVDIQKWIIDYLSEQKNITVSLDAFGNIYVTKGTAVTYPCIVSHTDTVHTIRKEYRVFQSGSYLFAMNGGTQTGVGGDDRCGIWACCKAIRDLDVVKAVFFRFEESGMQGSSKADMSFFDNVRHVIQFDRKGNSDWINWSNGVSISTKEFDEKIKSFISPYGYKITSGVATDVGQLRKNGLRVCSVNISAGYYHAHSDREFINIDDLENAWDMYADFVTHFTEVEPFVAAPVIIPDEDEVGIFSPPKKHKTAYLQAAFEEGWTAFADWLISMDEDKSEEIWQELWSYQEEAIQRKEAALKAYSSNYVDTFAGCPKDCWANMIEDETWDGRKVKYCMTCHKEFPIGSTKSSKHDNQFGLFSDL